MPAACLQIGHNQDPGKCSLAGDSAKTLHLRRGPVAAWRIPFFLGGGGGERESIFGGGTLGTGKGGGAR